MFRILLNHTEMAQKVLVTTDLSKRSGAALRFAIQLASQRQSRLIFYHVMRASIPTTVSQEKYMRYIGDQIKITSVKLESFVRQIYRQCGLNASSPECVVEFKPFVDSAIIEYAGSRGVELICMCTRGAGLMGRVLGTNASAVLSTSPIPVLAVPHDYRRSRISHVLYASDLTNLSSELKQVKRFSDSVEAHLSVLHYGEFPERVGLHSLEKIAKRYLASGVNFLQEDRVPGQSVSDHLMDVVRRLKPSVLAVFTKHDKTLLQRIFPQSNSERISFSIGRPLLVFPK